MDTVSLQLALAEKKLNFSKQNEKREEWELLLSKDCNESFTEDACSIFFPGRVVLDTKKDMIKGRLDCSRNTFVALICCVRTSRHAAVAIL